MHLGLLAVASGAASLTLSPGSWNDYGLIARATLRAPFVTVCLSAGSVAVVRAFE
jgi:hypothetical protein